MDKENQKIATSQTREAARLAHAGTERERLDYLEGLTNEAQEALRDARQQLDVVGRTLFVIGQAVSMRRIVVLQDDIAAKKNSPESA